MADVFTRAKRSDVMSRIRSKNTRPEKQVRSALRALGFRYRLHAAKLPGRPDIVFPKAKIAIFIHGCFWHMHNCRFGKVVPKTNSLFWQTKRKGNVERDKRNVAALRKLDWKIITVWECKCRDARKFQTEMRKLVSSLAERNGKVRGDANIFSATVER